jgi:hypothetical protein
VERCPEHFLYPPVSYDSSCAGISVLINLKMKHDFVLMNSGTIVRK